VVISPVGYRGAGHSSPKHARRIQKRVQRHEAAVTPAVDAYTLTIYKAQRKKMLNSFLLIRQFLLSQSPKQRRFELMSAAGGVAIIQLPDHIATLRQRLIPIGAHPRIPDGLSVRAAIHHHDSWILGIRT